MNLLSLEAACERDERVAQGEIGRQRLELCGHRVGLAFVRHRERERRDACLIADHYPVAVHRRLEVVAISGAEDYRKDVVAAARLADLDRPFAGRGPSQTRTQ